jgi:hypothetical protein
LLHLHAVSIEESEVYVFWRGDGEILSVLYRQDAPPLLFARSPSTNMVIKQ